MPDMTADPLRTVCPTCGATKGTTCDFPDIPVGLRPAHVARYPSEPTTASSDRCVCGDPYCSAHGASEAEPGFADTMRAMTQGGSAHDRQGE